MNDFKRTKTNAALIACAAGFFWAGCQQTPSAPSQAAAPAATAGIPGGSAAMDSGVPTPAPERDAQIKKAVRDALKNAGAEDDVVPQVKNNVVVLTGAVGDLIAKKRIVEAAESIRGVIAVAPDIAVRPVERSDADIEKDVETALAADPAMKGVEALVTSKKGAVALGGTAPSHAAKMLATWAAENVRGVREVNNIMQVELAARSDDDVEREISERLAAGRTAPEDISIEVNEGRVVLGGTVGSLDEKSDLINDAYVDGVRSVDGHGLRVNPAPDDSTSEAEPLGDEQIRRAIEKAFVYDPRVLSFRPRVQVQDGVVTLSGEVSNLAAKRAAAMHADQVTGVREVRNTISVRVDAPLPDEQVAAALKDAYLRSPHVDLYQIDIAVENGRATLRGTVNTAREKWSAEEIAMRIRGITEIDNQIEAANEPEPVRIEHAYFHPWSYMDLWWAIPAPEPVADAALKKAVEDELRWSPFAGMQRIDVQVSGTAVTLSGEARSAFEKRAAGNCAYRAGARRVENRIEVARPDAGASEETASD